MESEFVKRANETIEAIKNDNPEVTRQVLIWLPVPSDYKEPTNEELSQINLLNVECKKVTEKDMPKYLLSDTGSLWKDGTIIYEIHGEIKEAIGCTEDTSNRR